MGGESVDVVSFTSIPRLEPLPLPLPLAEAPLLLKDIPLPDALPGVL